MKHRILCMSSAHDRGEDYHDLQKVFGDCQLIPTEPQCIQLLITRLRGCGCRVFACNSRDLFPGLLAALLKEGIIVIVFRKDGWYRVDGLGEDRELYLTARTPVAKK